MWTRQPRAILLIEATFADGRKLSFSFPTRHPRVPVFAQPVQQPEGERRHIAAIRISTSHERPFPFLLSKRDRVEVGVAAIGGEFWCDYEVLEAGGGPFVRRLHGPPPLANVPEVGEAGDWRGIPEFQREGIVEPRDDARIAREAMPLLASLCNRPDMPYRIDDLEIGALLDKAEDKLEDTVRKAAETR